ncbi:hypothetical protein NMY22_g18085 [Coprinellus aureogranulatus]|nr:hypothetical protein NMY22_g18085 [Coprinellus aureogranulatus]
MPSLRNIALRDISFDSQRFLEILQRSVEQGDKIFLPEVQSFQLIEPRLKFGGFDVKSFLQFVKFRHHLMQPEVHLGAARRPNSLRRITFGFRMHDQHDFEFSEQARKWELALGTISVLEKSYGIVVDRVFLSE